MNILFIHEKNLPDTPRALQFQFAAYDILSERLLVICKFILKFVHSSKNPAAFVADNCEMIQLHSALSCVHSETPRNAKQARLICDTQTDRQTDRHTYTQTTLRAISVAVERVYASHADDQAIIIMLAASTGKRLSIRLSVCSSVRLSVCLTCIYSN